MNNTLLRPQVRRVTALALAAWLAGCGGGDTPQDSLEIALQRERGTGEKAITPATTPSAESQRQRAAGVAPQAAAQSFFPSGVTVPADANVKGMFSPVYAWPLIPLHTVLLPDGRLMTYGTKADGTQTASFIYDVWDGAGAPDVGHSTIANSTGTDIFCSSQLVLPGVGNVFVAGGDNWTGTGTTNTGNNNSNVFDATTNTLARGPNMNRARWYSSSITLASGETYIQGGSGGTDRPEIRSRDGVFRLLSSTDTSTLDFMYPRNFVVGDGRVFGFDSAGVMYYVNTATGSLTKVGQLAGANTGSDSSAAMFRPGRILQFGGNSNGAVVIDVTAGGTPVVTPTQSMASQRRLSTATILPDGRVLASGGSPVWNDATNAERRAEIWDPATGQWTLGATGALPRLYHSVGLLLPDASVMVGAGGAPGPYNNTNTEIYYPPYFFTAGGQRAERPVISSGPNNIDIGRNFTLSVGSTRAISRVTLVKTGSVTHGWNMEQRFQDLTFSDNGGTLTVQAPARAGDAPPGYYMIFVIDSAGVPSVAQVASMGIAANPNPAVVPTLTNPGNQATLLNGGVNLQLTASDPNGDTLTYAASGLPTGLVLNTVTGLISGAPSATGSYSVVVTASDGVNVASASFVWAVSVPGSLDVQTLANPVASVSGASASFGATASGGVNPRYSWNFGDGSAASAWSASGSATHVYAAAGTYVVTLSITDDTGAVVTRSLLQTVYLPATAKKPSASTPIVVENPAGANPRVWTVNPDNDSVTAIDAVTGARLAEVAVGGNPRTLALSSTGQLWVVNKRSATISVIDTPTRTVTRTISLPRASQPHGIAMSPTAALAFVALEGAGQLLKLDTGTYAATATVAVGANVRHVSVSADGASVYATRFISPPLPGEGTAAVTPAAGSGGVVVQVNAAAMTVARNITLAVSTKPDAENQGRGLPNYLGAATISPDGTQAWVPSKQDNVQRGTLRDGNNLNFQNTVRAISSRLVMASNAEDLAARVDHDNASLASAAAFDSRGVLLFVALETSREVAVLDAFSGRQLMRVDTGRAPQGLALSADGRTLYVHNFMDRSVGAYDLRPLVDQGLLSVPLAATVGTIATEKLTAQVLLGKQLFYDARDTRLARDRYMSCAACHQDGGHDGRVWDLTGFGEGLRNTIALRGRAGMGQGRLHWSANFDEVQDFEGQIRALAGGSGLMSDAAFNTGTRSQPLGDRKTGLSTDLDALAAYVGSLGTFDTTPWRNGDGSLTTAAVAGRSVFGDKCAGCHNGTPYTNSAGGTLSSVGTIKASSGSRLGGPLTGLDVPTLRDAWATAPYLHDGSAATLEDAIRAHTNLALGTADLANVSAFVRQIGSEEGAVAAPGAGAGLRGEYFANIGLSGTPTLTRFEAVNFNWGNAAPDATLPADNFSVRWTGYVTPTSSGSWRFQTYSDDGVRIWVNGVQLINNWTDHSPTTNSSGTISLTAGTRYTIKVEFYERGGGAVMQLRWRPPGSSSYVAIPASALAAN